LRRCEAGGLVWPIAARLTDPALEQRPFAVQIAFVQLAIQLLPPFGGAGNQNAPRPFGQQPYDRKLRRSDALALHDRNYCTNKRQFLVPGVAHEARASVAKVGNVVLAFEAPIHEPAAEYSPRSKV